MIKMNISMNVIRSNHLINYLQPKLSDFCEDMCRDLDAERFAQTAGIPVDMPWFYATPLNAKRSVKIEQKIDQFRFKKVSDDAEYRICIHALCRN
jgi:hypothetical protein